ncbi:hypothetical protein BOTBODRAFT_174299 [Botryobasidium botryosum FD-172 SS1]|uniref:Hsp90 chaperone protein kinase-targeting subunit n=1 Tax=Botryobasidium botryosum (strain FD-172 SS1) TaxID=930990 RepID=A0A067MU77_BOTB1|nr:hypothetical protein BOTBODRAFT_174299 [Botryobasidium botryosum FD-172 SS1]
MPLNYSKWDNLELSDDSDIEGHPNVDKRSLIRWKQRDIHEKRELRKHKIHQLQLEIDTNAILLPRLHEILARLRSDGPSSFSSTVERLKTQGSPDRPADAPEGQATYDQMIEALLVKVSEEVRDKGIARASDGDENLGLALAESLASHLEKLQERQQTIEKDLQFELKEQARHITSDDIHEGWDSKYVPAKVEPDPAPSAPKPKEKKTVKAKETTYEVLNSGPSKSAPASAEPDEADDADDDEDDDDEDDDDVDTELTPSQLAFSKIPIGAYERSFEFIQNDRSVLYPGTTDNLLVTGFSAQLRGEHAYAKQCVHQGLLVQYCDKLGKDGVALFFKRMVSSGGRAEAVFLDDVEKTYKHIQQRVEAIKAEQAEQGGKEQIQLVPEEGSNQTISFNVPDGPPPEEIKLEGPGTENLDPVEVRKALQMQWDIFDGFRPKLKKALRSGKLEEVNKVLGGMDVSEAESVVNQLNIAGILSFAENQIRDETGKSK